MRFLTFLLMPALLMASFLQDDALSYINKYRTGAGLLPFVSNQKLNLSASKHANYLALNQLLSSTEIEGYEGFYAEYAYSRALKSGYNNKFIIESVSQSSMGFEILIDALFEQVSARLFFLTFYYDEIGIGIKESRDASYFAFDIGNSAIRTLCEEQPLNYSTQYIPICADSSYYMDKSLFDSAIPENNISIALYPFDGQTDITPVVSSELSECKITAYPITVHTKPTLLSGSDSLITIESIELFKGDEPIEELTHIQGNAEGKLNTTMHALIAKNRFDFNTSYTIKVTYNDDQIQTSSFRTKSANGELLISQETHQKFYIESNKLYSIYLKPDNCNDVISSVNLNYPNHLEQPILSMADKHTVDFKAVGNLGDSFTLYLDNGKEVELEISAFSSLEETLKGNSYPISGYFINYGSDAFDWIFISAKEDFFAKLEGMNNNGYLLWSLLDSGYLSSVEVGMEEITFNPHKDSEGIYTQLEAIGTKAIDGYFIHYGDGAYDWIFVSKSVLAKLEGMQTNGNLIWKILDKSYFEDILLQGTSIEFR